MSKSLPQDILVICPSFPPYPGIGGRRWAKFSKYLAQAGLRVHVICFENDQPTQSLWTTDVAHPNIHTYPIPSRYPTVILHNSQTFLSKLNYKIALGRLKLTRKGNIYDRAINWEENLLKMASKLIESHKIKNVIVTIPPFKSAYYLLQLKKANPDLNLIVDYRDLWTDNHSFLGFEKLSETRRQYEKNMELEVMQHASYVLTVAEHMKTLCLEKNKALQDRVMVIQNGYDPEDITVSTSHKKDNQIRFAFTGTLYSHLDYVIVPFVKFLKQLQHQNPKLYNRLSFDFYGDLVTDIKKIANQEQVDIIHAHAYVDSTTSHEIIANSDYTMLFTAPDHAFSFSTKFFEYLAHKKPIITFSTKGALPEFITTNKIGFAIIDEQLTKCLTELFQQVEANAIRFNPDFDIEQYAVTTHVKKIQSLLKP